MSVLLSEVVYKHSLKRHKEEIKKEREGKREKKKEEKRRTYHGNVVNTGNACEKVSPNGYHNSKKKQKTIKKKEE